ncbi:MAG: hypothetical protein NZ524_02440 [Thiobacillaceae bacterium]|nr:hypothetical protein [Thiobacillaceae bacterium]MCX7672915.1 hypothetical protein [Thiobacillaceae bacterium]MDW8322663.1 hypothetical protein [Burkholderiales bacterium]
MSGYDEEAYKAARASVIRLPCPFERALLSRCVECRLARRLLLAEREAISCTEDAANAHCRAFHRALHENARFALHIEPDRPWPFGKEIRAQCGGVLGLKEALEATRTDVADLVQTGIARYGAVEDFPYSHIMRAVVHYEPRRRRA